MLRRIKRVSPGQWVTGGAAVTLTTASRDLADDARWEEKYCEEKEPCYHILSAEELAALRRKEQEEVWSRVQALSLSQWIEVGGSLQEDWLASHVLLEGKEN